VSWLDYANHELGRDVGIAQAVENTERAYWFDEDGQPLADSYIRYECLDEDYRALCQRLHIPYQALPRLRVGRRDRSRPYWDYYDDDTRDRVAAAFDREIAYFGYRFGE
jgi:hypothetical protein